MSITLQEVIEHDLLSEEVIADIPEYCDCGTEILFTDSLRQIYCPNTRCIYKVAARLEAMAKKMQADGWGESTCEAVCREFGMISPYQVFLLENQINSGAKSSTAAFEKKVRSICDPQKRSIKLWEIVQLGGIPNIESIAYKIFDGYDTMEDAYKAIEEGQVPFIAEKLGLKNAETGVLANNVYKTLKEYKEELIFAQTQFTVYKPDGKILKIAITDGVYGFKNKPEFISYLNRKYAGKIHAMFMNSVTYDTDILVCDTESNHTKMQKATKINDKFLTKEVESGNISADSIIGSFKSDLDIIPIGFKILVTTSEDLVQRLDVVCSHM